MIPVGHALRIVWTAIRFRLDQDLIEAIPQTRGWRWLFPGSWLPHPRKNRAVRMREAIESVGPTGVKFGQLISTRHDVLPADYASELALLQNQVPPFDSRAAMQIIVGHLKAPTSTHFRHLDSEPFASGSLAQVYGGNLLDGSEVVVKVIRPGIREAICRDLDLLAAGAQLLGSLSADAQRLKLMDVVRNYREQLMVETDLRHEARNTTVLRRNFANSPLLTAPRVYSRLSGLNVLVMERMRGIPVSQVDELRARGTDLQKLAIRGVETFFTQVFEHNLFHADMHPGNVLVDVSDPADPSYIAIDCAVMGQLEKEDQEYLARNMLAFFNQDFVEIARLQLESGWVPSDIDLQEFERVLRTLLQPMAQKPLSEISFAGFLFELLSAARRLRIEVQPHLVLLQKTLVSIEGLGRALDPDLDLWMTGKPYIQRWIWKRYGPAVFIQRLAENLPSIIEVIHKLPEIAANADSKMKSIERALSMQAETASHVRSEVRSLLRSRLRIRVLGTALVFLGGLALMVSILNGTFDFTSNWASTLIPLSAVVSGLFIVVR